MAFQLKGISLLGFVSSCQRAGLLRQHLKVSIHRSLLDFGRTMDSIDAEGPSLPVQDVEAKSWGIWPLLGHFSFVRPTTSKKSACVCLVSIPKHDFPLQLLY